jgi:hypothetical protein
MTVRRDRRHAHRHGRGSARRLDRSTHVEIESAYVHKVISADMGGFFTACLG